VPKQGTLAVSSTLFAHYPAAIVLVLVSEARLEIESRILAVAGATKPEEKKKGGITVIYVKPMIELAQSAVGAIQSSSKSVPPMLDAGQLLRTSPAYEADE
jgi:hypothetical protein